MNPIVDATPLENRLHPALLGWAWRNYRWVYLASLGLFLILPAGKGLISGLFPPSPWPHSLLMLAGVYIPALTGLWALSTPIRNQTASFLLARPLSRRQVYHTLLTGALGPWLFLTVGLNLYALTTSLHTGREPIPYYTAHGQTVFFVLYATWTLALFLLGAGVGLSGYVPDRRLTKVSRLVIWILVLTLAICQSNLAWFDRGVPAALAAHGPILAITGLVLAAAFYQTSWRAFQRLDL